MPLCGNCGIDIGDLQDCPYCGFNPVLDNNPQNVITILQPEPIRITLMKSKNAAAVVGFIFSFFAFIPLVGVVPLILSMILNIVGLVRSRYARRGKVLAIVGLLFNVIAIIIGIVILVGFFREAMGFDWVDSQ